LREKVVPLTVEQVDPRERAGRSGRPADATASWLNVYTHLWMDDEDRSRAAIDDIVKARQLHNQPADVPNMCPPGRRVILKPAGQGGDKNAGAYLALK
jgi:hypothetical protein